MIRVLHIVTCMERAGLQTMIMNYYRYIDRLKIQFDFLEHRSKETEYDKEIERLGGKIYRIHKVNPCSLEYRNQLDMFFRNHSEYKIVHCHMNYMSGLPLEYAKKNGIPIRIAHIHSTNIEPGLKYFIKKYYKTRMLKNATDYFACGKAAGNWAFGKRKFTIVHNAIDTKLYQFDIGHRKMIRDGLGLSDQFVIGHVGRFSYPKNHIFMIDIFKEVIKIDKNAILLLVGEGNLEKQVRKKVAKEGLENNVIFFGESSEVEKIMSAIDIFLFPSLYEGVPVTLIEAQYSGLRCVISNKVPKESVICSNVTSLGLNLSAKEWAERIIKNKKYNREETIHVFECQKYDIYKNAKWIEKKYFSMLNLE